VFLVFGLGVCFKLGHAGGGGGGGITRSAPSRPSWFVQDQIPGHAT
jgi:hypothetical protein